MSVLFYEKNEIWKNREKCRLCDSFELDVFINLEPTTQANHYDSLSNPTVVLPETNLALTAFLQGLYVGSGTMTSAPFNADGISPNSIADSIIVELRNASTQVLAYSKTSTISTAGISNVTFAGEASGGTYYIVVKHRNSIATWSANPVLFSAATSYSFASSDAQAIGNNLANLGNGVYGIFSGDLNQDGSLSIKTQKVIKKVGKQDVHDILLETIEEDTIRDTIIAKVFPENEDNEVTKLQRKKGRASA